MRESACLVKAVALRACEPESRLAVIDGGEPLA